MLRVYTNEKAPGYEIRNSGTSTFGVYLDRKCLYTFEAVEQRGKPVSEAFASRRANDFFSRQLEGLQQIPDDKDDTDIINAPPSSQQRSREIDRLMAAEKRETRPEVKQRLRHNIMVLMRREESQAASVVERLLG